MALRAELVSLNVRDASTLQCLERTLTWLSVLLAALICAWFACWSCSCTVSSTAAAPKIEPLPAANPHASEERRSSKIASKKVPNVTSEICRYKSRNKNKKTWICLLVLLAGLACSLCWLVCLLVLFLHCVQYRSGSRIEPVPCCGLGWADLFSWKNYSCCGRCC